MQRPPFILFLMIFSCGGQINKPSLLVWIVLFDLSNIHMHFFQWNIVHNIPSRLALNSSHSVSTGTTSPQLSVISFEILWLLVSDCLVIGSLINSHIIGFYSNAGPKARSQYGVKSVAYQQYEGTRELVRTVSSRAQVVPEHTNSLHQPNAKNVC